MTTNEIITSIENYIDSNIKKAFMIDGSWGSGKTYFVKNTLIPAITDAKIRKIKNKDESDSSIKDFKIIYLSLYGLNTLSEIKDSISLNIMQEKLGKVGSFVPYLQTGTEILLTALNLQEYKESINAKKIIDKAADFNNEDQIYLFIFDDFERCTINKIELLGYINQITEHTNNKVILIANEEEITISEEVSNNYEQKVIAALLARNISHQKSDPISTLIAERIDSSINSTKNDKLTDFPLGSIQELRDKISLIFSNHQSYLKSKEKTIEKTIKFTPSFSEVYDSMIPTSTQKNVTKILENNKADIIQKVIQYDNLRFLESIISNIDFIFSKESFEKDLQSLLLDDIIKTTIKFKRGENYRTWNPKSYYENTSRNSSFNNKLQVNFKFIEDFIYFSHYSQEEVRTAISTYENDKSASRYPELDTLRYYWYYEDQEIESALKLLTSGISSNKYPTNLDSFIISALVKLNSIGFTIDIDDVIQEMGSAINTDNTYLSGFSYYDFQLSEEQDLAVKKFHETMMIKKESKTNKNLDESIKDTFNSNKWPYDLEDIYYENKQDIISRKYFLKKVDSSTIKLKIEESSVKEFADFRRLLGSIYLQNPIETWIKDKDFIENLISILSTINVDSKIKTYAINELAQSLRSIVKDN